MVKIKNKNQKHLMEAVKGVQRKYMKIKRKKWAFILDTRSQTKLTSKRWQK